MSERPDGTKRTRSRRAPAPPLGNGTTTFAAAAGRRDPRSLRPPTMRLDSARARGFLRQRRQLRQTEEDDFALELDPELLPSSPARFDHQVDAVRARRGVGVLDEVRMLRGDPGTADPVTLEAAELEHPTCSEVARRVLEHTPERPRAGRLRVLATGDEIGDARLDLCWIARFEAVLDPGHDLA